MGLNKKIVNPLPEARKDILDFTYVVENHNTKPFWGFLEEKLGVSGKPQLLELLNSNFCLTKVQNGDGLYCMFGDNSGNGVLKSLDSTEFRTSSVPKSMTQGESFILYYNHNGFQVHCKHHKEYWEWVEKRNPHRYQKNMDTGVGYDTKNMMHTFRLLNVGHEIATQGRINNDRSKIDREFLLSVRNGAFSYEECLEMANKKIEEIENDYKRCNLPDEPDIQEINTKLALFFDNWFKNT